MTMTQEEREAVQKGKAITARLNKERRLAAKAARTPEKRNRGRERDNGFLAYLRRQPCEARHLGNCAGPVQAAHVSYQVHGIPNSFGRGVKNHDRHANPLCDWHHNHDQHKRGEKAFWSAVGKDAYATAAAHYSRYLGGSDD